MKRTPKPFNATPHHGGLLVHDHLTEEMLGHMLRWRFGEAQVLSQYVIPGTRYRMDYVVERSAGPVAVEFDGPRHYTSAQQIVRDRLKTRLVGMEVIRIPLWLQLDMHTAPALGLADKFYVETTFKHGWVTDEVYPASYCEAGFNKFLQEAGSLVDLDAPGPVVEALSGLLDKELEMGEVVLTARQKILVEDLLARAVEACR